MPLLEKAVLFQVTCENSVLEKHDSAAILESLRLAASHTLYFMADIIDVTSETYYVALHKIGNGYICLIGGPSFDREDVLVDSESFVDLECIEENLKRDFKDRLKCVVPTASLDDIVACVNVSQVCNIFDY